VIGALLVVAQLAIVAHAPDTASTCDAIEISIAVSAPGGVAPTVIAPSLFPFDVLRSSGTPHVTYDTRGPGSIVAEYRYVITTDRIGTFAIEPFEARLGGSTARSRPIFIAVRQATRGNVPTVIARARVDTSLDVNFHALSVPETVYVGQQANYEVAVFLNETVRDRLRRNPTFFPPDMQSMLAYDLPVRADPPRRQVGSHCFDALVYQRALFPLMPGRFSIPPAQLVYSLPLSASFFSREETHELQTDSTVVVAIEPPSQGRPADYGGAVGSLRVAAKLDTAASRVGDPMRLTVRVSGTGNVKLFPRPAVGVPWGSLVKGDERVQVDTTARRIAGAKEFDWVLTPRIAGELDLPPIHYSYFNPDSRRYEVATTGTAHVRVAPGALASADTVKGETLLPLRTRYRGAPRAPLHEHPVFWAFLALAPLPALSFGARERRRRAEALRPVNRGARLDGLARARGTPDATEVRRAYAGALAERLNLEAESFTRPTALARALRRRGVSTELATDAERFLRELDEAAFALHGKLPARAAERAAEIYRAVDGEALSKSQISLRNGGLIVIALFCTGMATARALDIATARSAFDAGVAAYDRHDFVAAREAFIASVVAEPNAPDAWADLGTAAWAVAARFASSRWRPTCATGWSWYTRCPGRRPAMCRRCRHRGCSISRRCSGAARGSRRRFARAAASARPIAVWRRSPSAPASWRFSGSGSPSACRDDMPPSCGAPHRSTWIRSSAASAGRRRSSVRSCASPDGRAPGAASPSTTAGTGGSRTRSWCRSTQRTRRRRSSRTDATDGNFRRCPSPRLRASPFFPAPSPIKSRLVRSSNGRRRWSKS